MTEVSVDGLWQGGTLPGLIKKHDEDHPKTDTQLIQIIPNAFLLD